MSWWAYLERDGEAVEVRSHTEGGTIMVGGTDRAEMNVTYNYGGLFARHWPETLPGDRGSLREMLDGRQAEDTIHPLAHAVAMLGYDPAPDYWAATPGNAGRALLTLLTWAALNPDATWRIS